jgi:pyruvate/2-oxoglutarate dehydrogenase complex dihydrolipoamide dehydrogenase (E3) component
VQHAVLLGGGFISLELAEAFVRGGITTTIVEMNDQILMPFDKEMTTPIVQALAAKGVQLIFGQSAESVETSNSGMLVALTSGRKIPAELVVFGVGCSRNC